MNSLLQLLKKIMRNFFAGLSLKLIVTFMALIYFSLLARNKMDFLRGQLDKKHETL